MKKCTRCNTAKESNDFQIRKASKDGLTSACKECLRSYDKSRANLTHRVEARKRYALTGNGKIAGSKAKKKWAENNIVKRSAHIIVGNAVRDGKLIKQPCEMCGKLKVEAHHEDYEKPLEVNWLCCKHHAERHKQPQV